MTRRSPGLEAAMSTMPVTPLASTEREPSLVPDRAGTPDRTVTMTDPTVADPSARPAPVVGLSASMRDTPGHDASAASASVVFEIDGLDVHYGTFRAVRDVSLEIRQRQITAFIGPSGCGKTTVLRCLNRMNDLIENCRVSGRVDYHGIDLYDAKVDPVEVRKRIGMVFQKPNPFPKSIYENVAFGPKLSGIRNRGALDDIVEQALTRAALWDEVKDRLKSSAMGMSGGQQQRLCIARTIAVEPEVVLMDEPCSALDPIATARIEDLMQELKADYTIVIVTHNMQQAARVSDRTAFFTAEVNPAGDQRTGVLIEYDDTQKIFSNPSDQRTENYVTGRFG
jgi:phosphate transport system ATP-binding protein